MPERFEIGYQGEDNAEHRPVMIHRALLGSMERFAGILIEHYGGRFPAWLAPVQIALLPVSDQYLDYAQEVAGELAGAGVRTRVDERSESVGRKIRDAELAKLPLMVVVGEREQADGTASVRSHDRGDLGAMTPAEIPALIEGGSKGGEPQLGPGVTDPGCVAPLTTSLSRGNGCTEVFRVSDLYHGLATGTAVTFHQPTCPGRIRPLRLYCRAMKRTPEPASA